MMETHKKGPKAISLLLFLHTNTVYIAAGIKERINATIIKSIPSTRPHAKHNLISPPPIPSFLNTIIDKLFIKDKKPPPAIAPINLSFKRIKEKSDAIRIIPTSSITTLNLSKIYPDWVSVYDMQTRQKNRITDNVFIYIFALKENARINIELRRIHSIFS